MTKKSFSISSMLIILALIATILTVFAQTSPGGFTNEPDKSMAKAHESFVKGEMNKAAEFIAKAATYVKKEADEVAKDTKEGAQASVEAVKKVGKEAAKDVKAGAEEFDKLFKGISEGIEDLGRKL